ncbi:hypothetical protein [Stenotrophomonas sp.]|uniref:ComEC/Rec2 family competence protein n=1 Tax=Stenotrophomonas sp. TaxID=69392 RepID=UPI0028A899EA|nr:hypothetical protein [Stenotrophomonas sp.]
MFEIEMLPAREGDALWIRYGDADASYQILIDGGRAGTYQDIKDRLAKLPEDQRKFELFVITHVDRDHIEGALKLLEDPDLDLTFKEVWFNGYQHLRSDGLETFGAVQGERLTAALLRRKECWNTAFDGGAVKVGAKDELVTIEFAGGLELTVLSPDAEKLQKMIPLWEKECRAADLVPGIEARRAEIGRLESFGRLPNVEWLAARAFKPDKEAPNGSSIALLAEYCGKRVLLGGDAHVDRLAASVAALAGDGGTLALDAFKLPHHGASGNVSQHLLELIDCRRYLISTNGNYFQHPRAEAIARILKFGGPRKAIYFNYATDFTSVWSDAALQREYDYVAEYSEATDGTLVVIL